MLITSNNLKLIQETKDSLNKAFKMKDLGELKYFLDIEFARSELGLLMSQRKYNLELISEAGLSASKTMSTPIEVNIKSTSRQYDDHIGKNQKLKNDLDANQATYQRLIGKLLYLTVTRPDISLSVQTLSQFLQQPKKSHMETVLRVVKYIKQDPSQGILLSSKKSNIITACCNAD